MKFQDLVGLHKRSNAPIAGAAGHSRKFWGSIKSVIYIPDIEYSYKSGEFL